MPLMNVSGDLRSCETAELRNRIRDLEHANETIRHSQLELETRVQAGHIRVANQITSRDEFMRLSRTTSSRR